MKKGILIIILFSNQVYAQHVEWLKRVDYTGNYGSNLHTLEKDNMNNIYIGINSSDSQGPQMHSDIFKVDAAGNTIWRETLPVGTSGIALSDSFIYIAGYDSLRKMKLNGDLLWQKNSIGGGGETF